MIDKALAYFSPAFLSLPMVRVITIQQPVNRCQFLIQAKYCWW